MSNFNAAFEAQFDIKDSEPVEAVNDTVNEDSGSRFEEVAEATSDKSAEELLSEAKKEVESQENVDIDTSIQTRTTKNASEKQPQEAANEINSEVEKELAKLIKARSGETEYEIAEDAMFKIKIDGEEVDVSLSDLRNNYSGKTAWDKKFSELDSERKAYLEDKTAVEKYVNEFAELAASGDKMKALEFLATISGQDALQFRRDLRSQVMEEVLTRQQMSEDQIRAMELEEELNFVRRQKESEQQSLMQSQAQVEVQNQVMGIQETFGLSDQGLVDLYDGVVQKYGDSLSDSEVIQALEQEASAANEGAEYLLGKVDEALVNDSNREAVAELILSNPKFSEEDFMDILSEAFGESKKSAKSVSKKVKTAAKKVNEPAKPKLDKKEYVSFDDLY